MSEPLMSRDEMPTEPASHPLRIVYRGRKFDLALKTIKLAGGGTCEREVIVHRGAVVMLPLLNDGRIVLIRNYRYVLDQPLWELPAGTIDPGETVVQTAARELAEETGYHAATLEPLAHWYVSPGTLTERMNLVLCRDLTPGPDNLQPDEVLTVHPLSAEEVFDMIDHGEIEDAKTIIALLTARRRGLV